MKLPTLSPAKLKVLVVLLPLGALLLWVALRTGPMAPIPVTEVQVRQQALTPQLLAWAWCRRGNCTPWGRRWPGGCKRCAWMKHTLWYSQGDRLEYKPVKLQPLTVDSVPPKVRTF